MNILIVDDEQVSRVKLQVILEQFGQCTVAESGEQALEIVCGRPAGQPPFDLVTLDFHMPGMDGAQTLARIRQHEAAMGTARSRKAKVIMLTASASRELVAACLSAGCDDYIVKPINPERIREKLERMGLGGEINPPADDSQAVGLEIKRRLNIYLRSAPPIPRIAFHLRELINNGAGTDAVVDLLRQDVVLSARVISISNSAFYRGFSENRTIRQAIGRLGMRNVQQVVECICNRAVYGIGSGKAAAIHQQMWEHALATAHAAEILETLSGAQSGEDRFTMGLLHDIGRPVLLPILIDMEKNNWFGRRTDRAELDQIIDTWHAPIGATVLEKWGYSPAFVGMTQCHESKTVAMTDGISERDHLVIRCADQLAISAGFVPGACAVDDKISLEEAICHFGVGPDQIQPLITRLIETMEKIKGVLG